jgi:hypothetical protein
VIRHCSTCFSKKLDLLVSAKNWIYRFDIKAPVTAGASIINCTLKQKVKPLWC